MSDAQIVKEILSGDTTQYESLVERYLAVVRSVCCSYEQDPGNQEDLIQETFIDAYMKLNALRNVNRFGPWIAQIARNNCKAWIRKQVRRREVHTELAQQTPIKAEDSIFADLSDKELREWVQGSIQQLPMKTREAMLLFYVEGYSIEETARCLGIRESAIKKRLQYGRELVAEKLWQGIRERKDSGDSKGKAKSIVMALPLGTAPWLIAGNASAAGIFSGVSKSVSSWWVAGSIGGVLLCVSMVILPVLQEAEPAVKPVANVPVDSGEDDFIGGVSKNSLDDAESLLSKGIEDKTISATVSTGTLTMHAFYKEPVVRRLGEAIHDIPIPGVIFNVAPAPASPDSENMITGVTDENGECIFTDLPDGFYEYQAFVSWDEEPSSSSFQEGGIEVGGETPAHITLHIPNYKNAIKVFVISKETGKPLVDVDVQLWGDVVEENRVRSENRVTGEYVFYPEYYGSFELTLDSEKYYCDSVKGVVEEDGGVTNLTIEASEYASIYGRVLNADGSPPYRVRIMRQNSKGSAIALAGSDKQGYYRAYHDGGNLSIYASRITSKTETLNFDLRKDESIEHNIVFPPATDIYFNIRYPDGTIPDELGQSFLDFANHERKPGSFTISCLEKLPDGRFMLPYVIAGDYTIWIKVRKFSGVYRSFSVDDELETQTFDITLEPATLEATVRVVDEQGLPMHLERIAVSQLWESPEGFRNSEWMFQSSSSNREGIIHFKNLWPGRFKFFTEYRHSTEAGSVDAEIPVSGEIILTVKRKPEEGLFQLYNKDIALKLGNEPGRELSKSGVNFIVLSTSGKLRFTARVYGDQQPRAACDPGENLVYGIKSGYTAGIGSITINPDNTRNTTGRVAVILGDGGGIFGALMDAQGEAIVGEELYVFPAEVWGNRLKNNHKLLHNFGTDFAQNVRSDANGTYSLDFLPEGSYYVCMAPDTNLLSSQELPASQWAGPFEVLPNHETGPVLLSFEGESP